MKPSLSLPVLAGLMLASGASVAQQADPDPAWDLSSELELGAVYTTGNTEDENLRLRAEVGAERGQWNYEGDFDAFRSSKDDELAAERYYLVGTTTYSFDEDKFTELRIAHERDEFSGYEQLTDASLSYGQLLLRSREDMSLDYTVGAGMRYSESSLGETESEAILRLSSQYGWDVSDNARFTQEVSVEAGDRVTVTRAVSAIESDIMDNLSLKFSVRLRHQSDVPETRENLDTESAITLLIRL